MPLRPSWLISNAEIEATRADYLALGHWNRAAAVGTGTTVPAYYSGSPDLAKTVNVVRLRGNGTVEVGREAGRVGLADDSAFGVSDRARTSGIGSCRAGIDSRPGAA